MIDSLPHGSFFHATGGAAGLEIKERIKLTIIYPGSCRAGGCGYDVCDLESRWKMIILQLATCSRSRLKNSRLVYQTVGGYFCVL